MNDTDNLDLESLIKENFGTIVSFCRATEIDRGDLYKYFKGEKQPSLPTSLKMARALNLSCFSLADMLRINY